MKIKVLCISDSDKHFSSAIDEYLKRMGKDIEIVALKPEKNGTREQIIVKETGTIIAKLSKNTDYKILLSKDGKTLSTEDIVQVISAHNNITLIIGGPYGFDEKKLDSVINMKLSF